MTFEQFMHETMLPAECDDERVMVGMRLAWDTAYSAGLERAAEIVIEKDKFSYRNEHIATAIREEIKNGLHTN